MQTKLHLNNQTETFDASRIRFQQALDVTCQALSQPLSATLFLLDTDEMFLLNNQLRQKPFATDVLSLSPEPFEAEVYLCPEFIIQQGYGDDRFIHLWVHGLLHCAGHTHDTIEDTQKMQQLERNILQQLHIKDPYV